MLKLLLTQPPCDQENAAATHKPKVTMPNAKRGLEGHKDPHSIGLWSNETVSSGLDL